MTQILAVNIAFVRGWIVGVSGNQTKHMHPLVRLGLANLVVSEMGLVQLHRRFLPVPVEEIAGQPRMIKTAPSSNKNRRVNILHWIFYTDTYYMSKVPVMMGWNHISQAQRLQRLVM